MVDREEGFGFWVLGFGFWGFEASGFGILSEDHTTLDPGLGFVVLGLMTRGVRVYGSEHSGFGVQNLLGSTHSPHSGLRTLH